MTTCPDSLTTYSGEEARFCQAEEHPSPTVCVSDNLSTLEEHNYARDKALIGIAEAHQGHDDTPSYHDRWDYGRFIQ